MRRILVCCFWGVLVATSLCPRTAAAQDASHTLPEQYIWTAGDVTALRPDHAQFPWDRPDLRADVHRFRAHFLVRSVPRRATLYIAGPRWARVFLNGRQLREFSTNVSQPINFRTFHLDVTHALRQGNNVLSLEVIRGRGIVAATFSPVTQQLAYGEALAVRLDAGRFGDAAAPALLISDRRWKSQSGPAPSHWQATGFNDASWPLVGSLGPIESNIDLFQWSADAGMYGWPGYMGMSGFLRTYAAPAVRVLHVYPGQGAFRNVDALTQLHPSSEFVVKLSNPNPTDEEAPSLLLDFGREVAGRILFDAASARDALVSVAYGESELEALATGITSEQRGGNFLGTNLVDVPAGGVARGPKSGFRYVRIRFLRGAPAMAFHSIRLEGITYPVQQSASFHSSDPVLNQIWNTAAYTVHLCMQDDIWDAPKRDRGRWAGDLDVEADSILTAFGDTRLLEDTLRRLAAEAPAGTAVNGIAGYTAQWVHALYVLYLHTGDQSFVRAEQPALLQLLRTMDADLDPATGLLRKDVAGWLFVDWAPQMYGTTAQAHVGTLLAYLRAYEVAPALLRAAGDEADAQHYVEVAARLQSVARKAYVSAETQTAGPTWQLNTLAVLTGVVPGNQSSAVQGIFEHVQQSEPGDGVISPYFSAFLLQAMSETHQQDRALAWIRSYWGGMLDEGATSFWEAYDLRWPKQNPQLSLQADGTSGFFVSLAHGWSTEPLSWLSENVLGVTPTTPGYASVDVRPDLMGLHDASGSVATPHGLIEVTLDAEKGMSLVLPAGVEHARVVIPGAQGGQPILLTHAGQYHFSLR